MAPTGSAVQRQSMQRRSSLERASRALSNAVHALGAIDLDPQGSLAHGLNTADVEEAAQREFQALLQAAIDEQNLNRTSTQVKLPPRVGPSASASDLHSLEFVQLDISKLHHTGGDTQALRRLLVDNTLATEEQDNYRLLKLIREREDKVGVELSRVEVRFSNLRAAAKVDVGASSIPNVANFYSNAFKYLGVKSGLIKSDRRDFTILDGVSSVLKPGRLTLLLGPPGSGKTTLLKALAGLVADGDGGIKMDGSITYNGEGLDQFQVRRTCAYTDQVDNHMAEMTVRETLDFAARCLGTGHKAEYIAELRRREKEQGITPSPEVDAYLKATAVPGKRHNVVTDMTLRVLGLEVCADTIVGNAMMRGVSGGQRRRVTTGEMIVGPTKTLFMDEISTGLDSSTTFLIINCLRNFTHLQEATVLIALLQPPPEVFDLFDDVMLLSEGSLVYHGPREQVVPFFESCGFRPPVRKGVADFLQEVTSHKDQAQHWIKPEPYEFVPVQAFAAAYEASEVGKAKRAQLEAPQEQRDGALDPLVRTKYGLPAWGLFKATLRREWIIMQRNAFLFIFKSMQVLVVGFITGTVFLYTRLGKDTLGDGTQYMSMIFYSNVHLLVNGFSEMSILVTLLPVFFKQRNAQFFPSWAFSTPTMLMRIPYTLLEVSLWSLLVYFCTGMCMDAGRFWIYWVILVMMHQMALGMFRMVASVARNYSIAGNIASLILVGMIILDGFTLNKTAIHPWTVWFYWMNPMTYTFLGMANNELLSSDWQTPYDYKGQVMPLGEAVLRNHGLQPSPFWRYASPLILLGFTIIFNFLNILALKYFDEHGKSAPQFSDEFLADRELNVTGSRPTSISGAKKSESGSLKKSDTGVSKKSEKGIVAITTAPAVAGEISPAAGATAAAEDVELGITAGAAAGGSSSMTLPFTPLCMTFKDMSYSVPMPTAFDGYQEACKSQGTSSPQLKLLHEITGTFRPGVLTALMGVSGAGKTTLMDVLAGRKTSGTVTGDIRVGGHPKEQATFARVCGYVEQTDVHSPLTTVREALQFSVLLRLHGHDKATALRFADEVMDLVELGSLRDSVVGYPGINGLSVEQRKRLTIAVELVANPSIVFMDEPTSGLDARAAAIVMRAVRNTVNTGRTVVCTIHQPSIDIFEAFDELLLLRRGGHTIYHGPLGEQSARLVEYFQGIKGVEPIKPGVNPATWMLEQSTISQEQKLGVDFSKTFYQSELSKHTEALVAELAVPPPGSAPLHFEGEYAAGPWTQFTTLLWKNQQQYWRNPDYNAVRMLFTVTLGLLLGAIFWDMGMRRDAHGVSAIMGALFICVFMLCITNANTVKPVVAYERPIFYRERAAKMYNPFNYAVTQALIEIPYCVIQSIFFAIITYFMIQFEFNAAKFFWYFLFILLALTMFTYYGMASVTVAPSLQIAVVATASFYSIWFIFAGFLMTKPKMPPWWSWYYWLDPLAYIMYGLIGSQLGDVTDSYIVLEDGSQLTVQAFLEDEFGFKHSFIGWAAFIMVGFIASFVTVIIMAYAKLNWQKR